MFFFFFFMQKTAYEMGISDWSSDVCSSDLTPRSIRSARAASMSDTTRNRPRADPGSAGVTLLPKWIEHDEPGGVNCTARNASPTMKSPSSLQDRKSVV